MNRPFLTDVCPLLHSLYQTPAVRKAHDARVQQEQDEDNVPVIDGNPSHAVTAFKGKFTTDEIVEMIVYQVMSSLKSAIDGPALAYVVSDSSDDLPLKEETRRARVMQWIQRRRRTHPELSEDRLRYPDDAHLVPEGVRHSGGSVTELIDMDVLLHSARGLYTQLVRMIYNALCEPPTDFAAHMFMFVDLGEGTEPRLVIGSQIRVDEIPFEEQALREAIQAARPSPQVHCCVDHAVYRACALRCPVASIMRTGACALTHHSRVGTAWYQEAEIAVMDLPGVRDVVHHTVEGDLGLVKMLPHLMRSPVGDRYSNQPVLVRTVDTDVAMLILYHGDALHLSQRLVYWSSPVSGTWDLSQIFRLMRSNVEVAMTPAALMTAAVLSGCDFFQKKWLTHQIGTAKIWQAATLISRTYPEGVHGTPEYLDCFLRCLYAVQMGLETRATPWTDGQRVNASALVHWRERVSDPKTPALPTVWRHGATMPGQRPSHLGLQWPEAPPSWYFLSQCATEGSRKNAQAPRPTDTSLVQHSVAYARVCSYWHTMGATIEPLTGLKEAIEEARVRTVKRGRTLFEDSAEDGKVAKETRTA